MLTLPSNELIIKSQQETLWDHGNNFLYDLCVNNFKHDKDDVIITKVLFIGRIYAAALERNKVERDEDTSTFYIKTVAPTFRESGLDIRLKDLLKINELTKYNIPLVLDTHNYLIKTLNVITGYNNRSFCSKYLHFHLPNLFFIYDSIALTNMRKYTSRVPDDLNISTKSENIDVEYAKYFCKCFGLRKEIEVKYKTKLTTRQFDNLLLEVNK